MDKPITLSIIANHSPRINSWAMETVGYDENENPIETIFNGLYNVNMDNG